MGNGTPGSSAPQDTPHLIQSIGRAVCLIDHQQYAGAVSRQEAVQVFLYTADAKEKFGPVFKEKIIHDTPLIPPLQGTVLFVLPL